MKTSSLGLLSKIVLAILGGVALGYLFPVLHFDFGIRLLNTLAAVFNQILRFIVPFIILGMVTPAIADTGRHAGRLLLLTVALAYFSTVGAGYLSYFISEWAFPRLLETGAAEKLAAAGKSFPVLFSLKIPPVMDVMTALACSFLLGLGMIFTGSESLRRDFGELRQIVAKAISSFVMPLLPFYIMALIADMTAAGKIAPMLGSFVKVILMCVALTWLLLFLQYSLAGLVTRRNPLKSLWNMLPAYFTALSICSSAATIPVTMRCARNNGASEDTTGLVIPLCGTIHLAGSATKVVACAVAFMVMHDQPFNVLLFTGFIFTLSVTAVAAPGVAGGVITCSLGLLEAILGFSPQEAAMLMAVYLAMDGVGTACNVSGDAAIALVVDRFAGKNPPAK